MRVLLVATLLALIVGGAVGLWGATTSVLPVSVRSAPELATAFESEQSMATRAGLVVAEARRTTAEWTQTSIALDAGECIAVVSANFGPIQTMTTRLEILGEDLSSTEDLAHLAVCVPLAATAEVVIARAPTGASDRDIAATSPLRYAILRGRVADLGSYPRAFRMRAVDDPTVARAALEQRLVGRTAIGGSLDADADHAILLPVGRATWAGLRALTGRRDAEPGVAIHLGYADPFYADGDVAGPPRIFTSEGQGRALAVVDAGALGAACVEVFFLRLGETSTPLRVRRERIPDRATIELPVEGAIAVDRLCPASGLFAYSVAPSEIAPFVLRVAEATATEPSEPPTPSPFGRDGLEILPVPLVATLRADCAAEDVDACMGLAVLAHDHVVGAGRPRAALEPICRTHGGDPCDALAGLMERVEAEALELRACVTGTTAACVRRGVRQIDQSELDAAYQTFAYACAHGSTDGCEAADQMIEWQITPPGLPVPAAPG